MIERIKGLSFIKDVREILMIRKKKEYDYDNLINYKGLEEKRIN